jgi:hypothetical protein
VVTAPIIWCPWPTSGIAGHWSNAPQEWLTPNDHNSPQTGSSELTNERIKRMFDGVEDADEARRLLREPPSFGKDWKYFASLAAPGSAGGLTPRTTAERRAPGK